MHFQDFQINFELCIYSDSKIGNAHWTDRVGVLFLLRVDNPNLHVGQVLFGPYPDPYPHHTHTIWTINPTAHCLCRWHGWARWWPTTFIHASANSLFPSQEYFANTFPEICFFCIQKNEDSLRFSPGRSTGHGTYCQCGWHALGSCRRKAWQGKCRWSIDLMFSLKKQFCLFCFPSHSAKVGSCTAAPKTFRIYYTTKTSAENLLGNPKCFRFCVVFFGSV